MNSLGCILEEDRLPEGINDVYGCSAVCFLGAGFSSSAKDSRGNPVPTASELSQEIREVAELTGEEDASLSDLADYCESKPELNDRLIQLLLSRLTLCKPSEIQRKIMALPWRSVFTTNFDDIAEEALKPKQFSFVTPTTGIGALKPGVTPIYYLHGRAKDILDGSNEPGLVLSETNYLKLKDRNRDLFSALENEIHTASTVFFIGYSLRDMDIASRLFNIPNLREKSIVIAGPDEGLLAINRLKKFGEVFGIGISGLCDKLPDQGEIERLKNDNQLLRYVKLVDPSSTKEEVLQQDVEALILSGSYDYAAYAAQERSEDDENIYCIKRTKHLDELFNNAPNDTNRFLITSDLGNGKSTFFKQVSYEAHKRGYAVYSIESQLPEVFSEVDLLLTSGKRMVFLIDGHVRYRRAATYIGNRLPGNSLLIVSAAGDIDDVSLANIGNEIGGRAREISLDRLTNNELVHSTNQIDLLRFALCSDSLFPTGAPGDRFWQTSNMLLN